MRIVPVTVRTDSKRIVTARFVDWDGSVVHEERLQERDVHPTERLTIDHRVEWWFCRLVDEDAYEYRKARRS